MTFQQGICAAFLVALALMSAANAIIWLNGMETTSAASWLMFAALPFLVTGVPGVLVRYTGVLRRREPDSRRP